MRFVVIFFEFGVKFTSEPVIEILADELLQKLVDRGITASFKEAKNV